ncbi:uncharacterized protein [Amphiura filiformis]|uniref:uncharacterized protein isoform X1 n=1 Tax=Amphiura filiformis TaxID=82378 RepID=UPI003B222F2D
MAFRREILNTYDFIDEWRMEPCLWNDRAEGYRDKSARESALKRLAEKFNLNEFEAKAKMTNLRTYYVRELSKVTRIGSTSSGEMYVSQWPYFKYMEFLRDHVTHRKQKNSIAEPDTQNQSNNEETHEEDFVDTGLDDHEEATETASPPSKRSSKNSNNELDRRRKKVKTKEGELLDLASGLLRRQAVDRKEEDADDVFGRHIAHELRNITDPRAKQLAKVQIQNILYEVQFGTSPLFAGQEEST